MWKLYTCVGYVKSRFFENAYTKAPVKGYESTSGTASAIYSTRYRW